MSLRVRDGDARPPFWTDGSGSDIIERHHIGSARFQGVTMYTTDGLKNGMARPQAARWDLQDGTGWPVLPSNRVTPLRSRTVSCRDATAISGVGTEGRS